jgi:hypothetical protein
MVIPSSMRGYFVNGEKLFLLKNKSGFILRKMKETKNQGYLEFAIETENAWKRIEQGQAIKLEFDDFLNELTK